MKSAWLRLFAVVAACLLLGIGIAWILLVEWLHEPPSHTIQGLRYLLESGIVSLVAGSAATLLAFRFLPRLGMKIGLAWVFGSVAAIVNIFYTPLLMIKESSDIDILVVTLLFCGAVSLAFAFLVSTLTTWQLRTLHEGAVKLAAGDFGARVPVQGSDETADLAQAFNRMSEELGTSFERERLLEQGRRNLVAAVSHDLRTPLASIRAMIEAINDGVVAEPAAVHRYLALIQQESEHLGSLIEDLFELSRIESGSLELRLSSIPVPELVMETVEGLQIQAQEKGIDLRASYARDIPSLALDGPRIQRVFVNLIQNAVRHTPPGGRVNVDVRQQGGRVQVTVLDSGEGIATEDQPHVFEQFYRGEKSRSRGGGGAGLGLAIARGIVEAHRGTIQLKSVPGQGSRFVVTL